MNTKKLITIAVLFGVIISASAQITEAESKLKTLVTDTVSGWKTGGISNVNFAQTALINWAAGGENSYAVNGLLSLFANYKSGENAWDNSLDMGYGLLNQGEVGLRKTDDKFDFLSKYGRKAFTNFYYTALVNFKTQFAPGYNYGTNKVKISNLFAPAYLLTAVGLNYQPNKNFNAFLAPFTGKMTIVTDEELSNAGAFGVEKGKQLPFRYYSAYKAVVGLDNPQIVDVLNKCIDLAYKNAPHFAGKTISLVDNSGSARGAFTSEMGSMPICDIGNLTGIITAKLSDEGYVGVFGDGLKIIPVPKSSSTFDLVKKVDDIGYGIGQG
ncbi:MAG TPA: DUF3078 domain-containing protein, partial [Paludibacter sp.]|nr:DUF3078 domain-containing protein [Paludibacter sp.]